MTTLTYCRANYLLVGLLVCPLLLHASTCLANEAPSGLDDVLKDITPGMALRDFWDRHPDARAAREDRYLGSNDIAQQHQTLYVDAEADAWLGLKLMASYGFVDRRLKEWVLNWHDPEGDGAQVQTFFEGCIEQHGEAFQREAIRLHTAATGDESLDVLLPVLVWREENHVILAYHQRRAQREEEADAQSDHFMYALLPKADPFVEQVLVGDRLSEMERDMLYAPFPWLPEGRPLENDAADAE